MTRWPYCQDLRIQSTHIFWCVMSFQAGQYVNAGNPSAPAGAVAAPLTASMTLISVPQDVAALGLERVTAGGPVLRQRFGDAGGALVGRHTGSLGIWTAGISEPTDGAPWNSLPPNAMFDMGCVCRSTQPLSRVSGAQGWITTLLPLESVPAAGVCSTPSIHNRNRSGWPEPPSKTVTTKSRPALLNPSIVAVCPLITKEVIRVAV